jgi:bifunctional DNA-binding transcriptional regulator/antitoxin component of YhaV-PrlF toxin-antitoxin module
MEFISKLKKIGTGYFILIPKEVRTKLMIAERDMLEIQVLSVFKEENDNIQCKGCGNTLILKENSFYCENCGEFN